MQLYFAGAESPAHLKILRREGITRVAVNATALSRRTKDMVGWASQERLGEVEWVLYADNPHTPFDAALALLEGAESTPEAIIGPVEWATQTRLGEGEIFFLPTWDGIDRSQLRHFVEQYGGVFLPDLVVDNQNALRTAMAATSGGSATSRSVLGAITGRSRGLEAFDVVVSSAWWAVQKHGETQVWGQNKMHRYPGKDKLAKRMQHKDEIEALGIEHALVMADDPAACASLALRSWQQLEQNHNRPRVVSPIRSETGGVEVTNPQPGPLTQGESGPAGVARDTAPGRHGSVTLPVMGMERIVVTTKDLDGTEVSSEVESLAITTASLRKCDTCSLSMHCPSFSEGASCAFNIPVLIRSKDQLQGVMRAMVEVQTQRILFARFGEEVTGAPDPDVGREMDRLFHMVEKWKDIEDNRDTLELNMRVKGAANSGMLSRLFGDKVGANAMVLDNPIPSEAVSRQMSDD